MADKLQELISGRAIFELKVYSQWVLTLQSSHVQTSIWKYTVVDKGARPYVLE